MSERNILTTYISQVFEVKTGALLMTIYKYIQKPYAVFVVNDVTELFLFKLYLIL